MGWVNRVSAVALLIGWPSGPRSRWARWANGHTEWASG
jgi:hypothetical protein